MLMCKSQQPKRRHGLPGFKQSQSMQHVSFAAQTRWGPHKHPYQQEYKQPQQIIESRGGPSTTRGDAIEANWELVCCY